uniref:Uncharacterized protein n=2 Tax=Sus scrofa TaxID=9823 RepID=A0A4X1V303_PIG
MHRAITPSAYLPSPDYYKRLDHLQQGLRDRYGLPGRGRGVVSNAVGIFCFLDHRNILTKEIMF